MQSFFIHKEGDAFFDPLLDLSSKAMCCSARGGTWR